MAKGFHRRSIRVNGKLQTSPRFRYKKDAEDWYDRMRRKKQFLRDGFVVDDGEDKITVLDWSRTWIKDRMKNYPPSTWMADEQRLRDYVLPEIADLAMPSVTANKIRALLKKVTDAGRSVQTRTRVQALLSMLFSDAFNNDPPLVPHNPVLGIKFKERRTGKKKPSYLEDSKTCERVLVAAQKISTTALVIEGSGMMAGLRKQEMYFKYKDVDSVKCQIKISAKLEQATLTIKPGTKRGENVERVIPVPRLLIKIINKHRAQAKYNGDDDFVLARDSDGRFLNPRTIYDIHMRVCAMAEVEVTVHGLRHTFGREFAAKSGNMRALQDILGHTSGATTEIYSSLAGNRLSSFGEVVTFKLKSPRKPEKGRGK